MSEPQIHESVIKADRWAKVLALFFAMGFYLLSLELTNEMVFSMVTAATAAIGFRYYIPYHASAALDSPDQGGIHDHPATGDYHHGAIAIALLVSAVVMTGMKALEFHSWPAFIAGALCIAAVYWGLKDYLPEA